MKIVVSKWWILVFPMVLSLHLQKVFFFIFSLLSIHEMMHILMAHHFMIDCEKVIIYPFGLCAYLSHMEHHSSGKQLLVIFAGLSVHLIAWGVLACFQRWDMISYPFYQYLNHINLEIVMINLFPIYPLDGSRIIRCLLEYIFPYQTSKKLGLAISILCTMTILFLCRSHWWNLSVWVLLILIVWVNEVVHFQKEVKDFYLYRFLTGGIGTWKIHHHFDLYKNHQNLIIHKGKMYDENAFLSRHI